MNTVNSQNLEAQVVSINTTSLKRSVAEPSTTTAKSGSNTSVTTAEGQKSAAVGNLLPENSATNEAREEKLEEAITRINSYVQQVQRDLKFSVDDESGKTVIKVIDSQSKELIRQIPEEVLLQVARSIEDSLEGTLLEVKV